MFGAQFPNSCEVARGRNDDVHVIRKQGGEWTHRASPWMGSTKNAATCLPWRSSACSRSMIADGPDFAVVKESPWLSAVGKIGNGAAISPGSAHDPEGPAVEVALDRPHGEDADVYCCTATVTTRDSEGAASQDLSTDPSLFQRTDPSEPSMALDQCSVFQSHLGERSTAPQPLPLLWTTASMSRSHYPHTLPPDPAVIAGLFSYRVIPKKAKISHLKDIPLRTPDSTSKGTR